jgi:serine/threonine protein kinase
MGQKLLQYEVLEKLGEGARSTIYAVQDPTTGKKFAMKHVLRDEQKDIRFVEQMETEFELSKQFTHPNLRRTFELKIQKALMLKVTEAYLLMELVEGQPLDVRLPRDPRGMPDIMAIIDTFIAAAQGLRAMHHMGYAHCDIKPNNILRNDRGDVKVIDYGQSCRIGTVKERIQGTPDYIAPEQVARRPISVQTDVFNLGATLYWALSGKVIPTLYTVNKKGENSFLLDTRIDTPMDLNPRVPLALSKLTMDSISTKPQNRPADMDEFITRLELAKHIMLKQSQPQAPTPPDLASDSQMGAPPIR